MKFTSTGFKDLFVCEPKVIGDKRGYFFEAFNCQDFKQQTGLNVEFVQDNQSLSEYGVLRGLHFQSGRHAQAKLVRVLKGRVLDVVVDIRPESQTYGKQFSLELSEENKKQLFVPRGFAHGFIVLSEQAEFFYKCDNFYNPESEGGIRFDDPYLNVDWLLPRDDIKISEKDAMNPSFLEQFENIIK